MSDARLLTKKEMDDMIAAIREPDERQSGGSEPARSGGSELYAVLLGLVVEYAVDRRGYDAFMNECAAVLDDEDGLWFWDYGNGLKCAYMADAPMHAMCCLALGDEYYDFETSRDILWDFMATGDATVLAALVYALPKMHESIWVLKPDSYGNWVSTLQPRDIPVNDIEAIFRSIHKVMRRQLAQWIGASGGQRTPRLNGAS